MQNNPNQTNQKDPDNRGLDESEILSEQIRTFWCTIEDVKITFQDDSETEIRELREFLEESPVKQKEAPG
jgi:hypothetical protein